MEEIEENVKKGNEELLYNFLLFLKNKGFIDDWTFEYEKEISLFLNNSVLEKHADLIYGDLLSTLDNDNEMVCKVLNVILGKAE